MLVGISCTCAPALESSVQWSTFSQMCTHMQQGPRGDQDQGTQDYVWGRERPWGERGSSSHQQAPWNHAQRWSLSVHQQPQVRLVPQNQPKPNQTMRCLSWQGPAMCLTRAWR
ncbi:hypothetical protein RSAG8_08939, partial [Rhizoctonia solani AG-8 WAC10335]